MTRSIRLTVRLIDALGRTLAHDITNRGIVQAERGDRITVGVIDRLTQMGIELVQIEPLTSKDFRLQNIRAHKGRYHFDASLVVGSEVRYLGKFTQAIDPKTRGKFLWHAPSDALDVQWARAVEVWRTDVAARLAQWTRGQRSQRRVA